MERTKEVVVEITVDTQEEMFLVVTLEGESGLTSEFGPTPFWSDWESALKEKIGNEILSWVKLMMDEEGYCDE